MATCPHCLGPLTDNHRCPRRRSIQAMQRAGGALAGGVGGFVLMALLDPGQRSTHLDIWVIGAGMLVGAVLFTVIAGRFGS